MILLFPHIEVDVISDLLHQMIDILIYGDCDS